MEDVPDGFHATFMARSKLYRYRVFCRETMSPMERHYSYFFPFPLDLERMKAAAAHLVGEHDFSSFGRKDGRSAITYRRIFFIDISRRDPIILIEIKGDGFLWNMVRSIVGTLLEVGRGKKSPEEVKVILESKRRSLAGPTVGPEGLFLVKVEY
jgi:tRNA pseudouridine38-40 synthase